MPEALPSQLNTGIDPEQGKVSRCLTYNDPTQMIYTLA
jgi:hypothetical protein